MSKTIDFSKPLNPEDRDYLRDRPWLYRGTNFDDLEFADDQLDFDDSDDEEFDDRTVPDGYEEDSDENEEDEEVDLESLNKSELRELGEERGIDLPKKATRDELIELLS